jgi:adenosine deaminase
VTSSRFYDESLGLRQQNLLVEITGILYAGAMNLQALPKVELHRHLELSYRLSTLKDIARQLKLDLPTDDAALQKLLIISEPMKDLESVLNAFLIPQKLLATPEILERITFEACEDAFTKEGIRILELRFAPTFIHMDHPQLNYDSILDGILRGVRRAESQFAMAVGLIATIQRILPVKDNERVMDFVINRSQDFIGVDLADNEVGFDCKPFAPMFQRAAKAGLPVTIHAGEANFAEAPQSVVDAIEILGARRIGHGLQIAKDLNVIDLVRRKGVVLELCPYSNYLTNAVASTHEHPFRKLMQAGVLTTINSDDPGCFGSTLLTDYQILATEHNFSEAEFTRCNDIAASASFIPQAKRQKIWPREIV